MSKPGPSEAAQTMNAIRNRDDFFTNQMTSITKRDARMILRLRAYKRAAQWLDAGIDGYIGDVDRDLTTRGENLLLEEMRKVVLTMRKLAAGVTEGKNRP